MVSSIICDRWLNIGLSDARISHCVVSDNRRSGLHAGRLPIGPVRTHR